MFTFRTTSQGFNDIELRPRLFRWWCSAIAMLAACGGSTALREADSSGTVAHAGGDTPESSGPCPDAAIAVQVLGSGGPIADDDRASAAYLIWIDGRARALIDAGSGLLARFGATGARIEDLDVVALSHLHVDHSAGLPGLLKSGYFSERERPLPLLGPAGNEGFPAVDAFARSLLAADSGAYRYLSGYLDAEGGRLFALEPRVVPSEGNDVAFESSHLRMDAIEVEHGNVPALAFVVQVGPARIAFTGDQTAEQGREAFVRASRDADSMIAHHAIPEGSTELRHLHMLPSEIGALAADANVRSLVLSHNMRRALDDLERGTQAIREAYDGPLHVARDLECFVVR